MRILFQRKEKHVIMDWKLYENVMNCVVSMYSAWNLCAEHTQKFRKGLQYHFTSPIESEVEEEIGDTEKY